MTFVDIVDTQVHFNRVGSLEAGFAAMDAVGVAAVLYDECALEHDDKMNHLPGYAVAHGAFRPVSPQAESAALRHPQRIGVLRRVDYRDPDLDAVARLLAAAPYAKALRVVLLDAGQVDAFARGDFTGVMEVADRYDLPVVVLAPGCADLLGAYAEKFPRLQLVIDHCGAPMRRGVEADHLHKVLTLARYPNVSLKWAHAPFLFSSSTYPFADVIPLLQQAVAAFGPERVMWGSDYTVTAALFTWAETLFYIRHALSLSAGDKEWILGRTARRVLRWPATATT